jgi:hypothetical protein
LQRNFARSTKKSIEGFYPVALKLRQHWNHCRNWYFTEFFFYFAPFLFCRCYSKLVSLCSGRSLSLHFYPSDLDIERTLRQLRSERNPSLRAHSEEHMVEEPRPVLLRDHYIPSTYTPSSCLQLPNITIAQYEIKSNIIQMLPSF